MPDSRALANLRPLVAAVDSGGGGWDDNADNDDDC